jgi:hypothetical protein
VEGETEELGLKEALLDALDDALGLGDLDTELDGLTDGLTDTEGLTEGELEALGLTEAEALAL